MRNAAASGTTSPPNRVLLTPPELKWLPQPKPPLSPAAPIRDDQTKHEAHSVSVVAGDDGARSLAEPHIANSPIIATNPVAHAMSDYLKSSSRGTDLSHEGAHRRGESQAYNSPLVAEIIQLWRMRQRWHRAEKSLILQGRAICRAFCDGDKEAANALFDQAAAGEQVDSAVAVALGPFLEAIRHFDRPQKRGTEPALTRRIVERRLQALAHEHLLWPWVAAIKGFGPLNFAAIIGEAGEIASYRNPSCLWKRMGLAVIDGGRQRRHKDAELALIHGYSPSRRAVAYLLGECLLKAGGTYRAVYDQRKAAFAERAKSKAHNHADAMRYMVKRVLRDLWIEARRVSSDPIQRGGRHEDRKP